MEPPSGTGRQQSRREASRQRTLHSLFPRSIGSERYQ